MPRDIGQPLPHRVLGRTGIDVATLGFGGAPIADLYEILDEETAIETVVTAINAGVNLLDMSPLYGHGLSELRIGAALRHVPDAEVVICTKVGRVTDPFSPPGDRAVFAGGINHGVSIDYSYDGTMRSLEQSLLRLGRDRIDIALIHDVDVWTHEDALEQRYAEAKEGAVKALTKLRNEGTISGFGIGINEADMAARFLDDCDIDVVLLAGRYSLLEQPALETFLPKAEERNVGVILGGVFNSGILATGTIDGARYNYAPAPPDVLEKVRKLEEVCERFGIPLRQVAIQFVFGHPAVSAVVLGAARSTEVEAQVDDLHSEIPSDLWAELRQANLIPDNAPTP
ncbi:MAG: pyridoxal 4-dehydrogenase [Verrucomicrobiales bacterium]|nr:pyridoxal 4-dehydrogenase [Verrucomicrobiales bacterium]